MKAPAHKSKDVYLAHACFSWALYTIAIAQTGLGMSCRRSEMKLLSSAAVELLLAPKGDGLLSTQRWPLKARLDSCDLWGVLLYAVNPVPLTTQYVLVSNLCPECLAGSLDQEIAGDGRWTIEWHPVQCAVGSTPFVYSFQGSNPYYIKMQVSNHR